jgi:DNA-binding PadR family transcriptional regulator
MELTQTAYVILGMLSWRPMSGYDVKTNVDGSTRFFWAASYGQIYPELRRLAAAGLVEEAGEAEGGRARRLYRLTDAGRAALVDWLHERPGHFEIRDEGLLKLFFAEAAPDAARGALAAKRHHHEQTVERLRAIEAEGDGEGFTRTVLRYGIECHSWMAGWCAREEQRL